MANFYSALDITLAQECGDNPTGGYSNDPRDPGGETKWGISKRAYPNLDIKNLTKDQAGQIYFQNYWQPNHYGEIDDQAVANKCFDIAVNMGSKTANMMLQESVDAVADGVIGPATLAIVNQADPTTVLASMRQMQAQRYRQIAARNPRTQAFLQGWLNRVQAV